MKNKNKQIQSRTCLKILKGKKEKEENTKRVTQTLNSICDIVIRGRGVEREERK